MAEPPRQLNQVEAALDAVTAVRQVVHAIWALARAQYPSVEAAAGDATVYLDWIEQLVERLAGPPSRAAAQETFWIVVGPERPFCGPLARQIVDQIPGRGRLGLVGRRLVEIADTDRVLGRRVRFRLSSAASTDEITSAAHGVAEAVLAEGWTGRVVLLHPVDGTSRLHRVTLLAGVRERAPEPPETWSPSATVVEAAVVELVTGCLVVGVSEALRSEVRARLAAAEGARQASERKLGELQQAWRVLRQEQITREILELVSGRLAELGH